MSFSIEGKKILVTGGARGIGGESARYFAQQGAHVVTCDIRDAEGEQLAKEATEAGPGRVVYRHMDVSDVADIRAGVDFAAQELGGLDAVVNAAEIVLLSSPEDTAQPDWDRLMAVNAKGVGFVCQAAFPHLKEGGGSIVNVASGFALTATPVLTSAYSASKGAIFSYTRTIALEWATYGIRCNSVNPLVATPLMDEVRATMSQEEREDFERQVDRVVPLGRVGDVATDLAPVLAFLISDASQYVTSQIIGVDGGLVTGR
jgi:NAD(P)-dependent dehydrogenase (short-subunit alcohol dehydrogenase family)